MPLTAITYDIRPGCEEEVGRIFAEFRRVRGPAVPGEDGQEAGRVLSTAVFIRDAVMVRVIEYEGDLEAIARHMAGQPGVREVERKLKPFLSAPRDTDTAEGFIATFRRSQMRCLTHLSVRDPG